MTTLGTVKSRWYATQAISSSYMWLAVAGSFKTRVGRLFFSKGRIRSRNTEEACPNGLNKFLRNIVCIFLRSLVKNQRLEIKAMQLQLSFFMQPSRASQESVKGSYVARGPGIVHVCSKPSPLLMGTLQSTCFLTFQTNNNIS